MTWLDHHERSKELAAVARKLFHRGEEREAEKLYEKAAAEAERAMVLVPRERTVTFGAIAMHTHRLWRRARRTDDAARVAALIRGSSELFPITVSTSHAAPRSTPMPHKRS